MTTTHPPRRVVDLDLEDAGDLKQEAATITTRTLRRLQLMHQSPIVQPEATPAVRTDDSFDLLEPEE